MKEPKKEPKRLRAKKPEAKAYHHGDLRQALLAAARLELHETGWQGLSLRSVARRAGVTHTAAYHHFRDKQALLATIAAEGFVALDRCMAAAMEDAGADPLDRLLGSGTGYLRMATDDPQAYDLMFNGCGDIADEGSEVGLQLHKVGADPFLRLCNAVEAARTATGATAGDPVGDALLFWEVVHGCAMLARSGQLARMGIDAAEHGRFILGRLRALYPGAGSLASATSTRR